MSKLTGVLGITLTVAMVIMLLFVIVANAQTGLANAQGNVAQASVYAAQSTTTLVGQCMLPVVAAVSLAAGFAAGVGFQKLRTKWAEQQKHKLRRRWQPGPGGRWARVDAPQTQALPPHYPTPPVWYLQVQPPGYTLEEEPVEEDDFLDWGW